MNKYSVFIIVSLLFLVMFALFEYLRFFDTKLHITLCDVGQGDGIYIRTPKGYDILIDGGPDTKILDCLGSAMPLWDREIDVVMLTHPHADHLNGLVDVFERYRVKAFATENLHSDTEGFKALQEAVEKEKIQTRFLLTGDTITTPDGVVFRVVGPTKQFLEQTSPSGTIGERREFASLVAVLDYHDFEMLLTGDSQAEEIEEGLSAIGDIDIVQVPHHGSKTGLTQKILLSIRPELAVISVGKNRYGHPSSQILTILSEHKIPVVRTDEKGSIHIQTNGMSWSLRE